MVTTVRGRRPLPDGTMADDNIIVWTDGPAGDWSEPVVLIEVRAPMPCAARPSR